MNGADFPTPEVGQWVQAWRQTRQLTYDLLQALSYALMNFSPHPGFGTLARQVRHVGDIQACYLTALRTGVMDFSARPRQRALEQSREQLAGYLRHLDQEMEATLRQFSPDLLARPVDWGGGVRLTVLQHLMALLQHETLHQGMWAFYARIAEFPLPESWQKMWGLA